MRKYFLLSLLLGTIALSACASRAATAATATTSSLPTKQISPTLTTEPAAPTEAIIPSFSQTFPGGLLVEEYALKARPLAEPFTFDPVQGSQVGILMQHSSARLGIFQPEIVYGKEILIYASTGKSPYMAKVVYASTEGGYAKASVEVWKEDQLIYSAPAGDSSPIDVIQGLWVYGEHWAFEYAYVTNTMPNPGEILSTPVGQIVVDGILLNQQNSWQEGFGFQLIQDEPFYFFKEEDKIKVSYAGQSLPLTYDEIPHYGCCSAAAVNSPQYLTMITFFARRGDHWYYVEMGNYESDTPTPSTTAIVTQTPSETTQLVLRVEVQIAAQVGGEVTDIEINGTYAYLAVGPRLVIMDLSNPDILQVATMSDLLPGLGKALAIEGGRLCWISDNGYLLVFTLGDPTKPSLVGQFEIPSKADEIIIKDGIAWVGFLNVDSEGLRAYDLNSVSENKLEEIAKVNTHMGHGSVVLAGNYLYLYQGFVIDISNPRQPTIIKIGEPLNSPMAFVPPYAYVYWWESLDPNSEKGQIHWQVWDISDPGHPNQVGDATMEWDKRNWIGLGPGTISGQRMYSFINEGVGGDITLSCPYHLQVADISDPATPHIIASTDQLQLHCVRDVKAVGNRLYVVDWHGLSLVDISNLSAPRVLDRFGSPPQIEGLALKRDTLFAGTDFVENSINVFNMNTPHLPDFPGVSLLGSAPYLSVYEAYPPGTASGLAVSGNYLFVPQRNEGLSVVDISQPRLPKVVVHNPNIGNQSGYVQRAVVAGETLFLTINREQIAMADIHDPTHPRSLGMLPGISSVFDLVSANHLLYILGGDPGAFIVLNMEDPLAPKEITRVPISLGSAGARISITGERAYISGVGIGARSDLAIFDLSDPTHPTQVGVLTGLYGVWDIAGQGDTIMVACATYIDSDIWVVDARNPSRPELVGHFKTPGMSTRVVADDNFFYLSSNQGGLWKLKVIDLK